MTDQAGHKVIEAVAELLGELDTEIAGKGAVCRNSGLCCKFEQYGHRLYVTRAELLYFAAIMRPTREKEAGLSPTSSTRQPCGAEEAAGTDKITIGKLSLPLYREDGTFHDGCPYQIDGFCTARTARPMGCRVYFCDAGAQGWQAEVYEKYHTRLKEIHERFGLAYEYMEWREGLAGLSLQEIRPE